jgi:hypothetical protein
MMTPAPKYPMALSRPHVLISHVTRFTSLEKRAKVNSNQRVSGEGIVKEKRYTGCRHKK